MGPDPARCVHLHVEEELSIQSDFSPLHLQSGMSVAMCVFLHHFYTAFQGFFPPHALVMLHTCMWKQFCSIQTNDVLANTLAVSVLLLYC